MGGSNGLVLHVEWWRAYSPFVRLHGGLTMRAVGQKAPLRTPAMAAGLPHKLWAVHDILKMPIMPALE